MSLEVEATYENGVLKPDRPLPLDDRQRVRVTVHVATSQAGQSYGLLQWTGDPKILETFATDPDLDYFESS